MALDNKTSLLNTPLLSSSPRGARDHFSDSPFKHSRIDTRMDDSEHLTDGTQHKYTSNAAAPQEQKHHRSRPVFFCFIAPCLSTDSSLDQSELVAELLKELSNHNERIEERKAALCDLLKLIRENTLQVWDEHFKTILLLLMETMGDREVRTPASFPVMAPQMEQLLLLSS